MKVSYKWLKELVDFDWSAEELALRLTMAGLDVAGILTNTHNWDKIVVGEILAINPHLRNPNLVVCQVNVGTHNLNIVCGANNIKVNDKVPVALLGSVLPNGQQVGEKEISGVRSFGMLCSERELNLGANTTEIMILDPNIKRGVSLYKGLDLEDYILDLDLTPNRPDCLSALGVAREIFALGGKNLKKISPKVKEVSQRASNHIKVILENKNDCPRYAARIIRNVSIKNSPAWLVQKIEALGIRAINNIVDATNYVMLELGHPLHAFDLTHFPSQKVLVRRGFPREKMVTLDGVERELSPSILLITNGDKPVAVAGIIGGKKSEVTNATTDILLESACFNPKVIRQGRMALGVITEASQRFEKGTSPEAVSLAMDRAAQLIVESSSGEVLKGRVDNYPKPEKIRTMVLVPERVNQLLGAQLNKKSISSILKKLQFPVKMNGKLRVKIPSFRRDIFHYSDLVEEVARIYGYEKIPINQKAGGSLVTTLPFEEKFLKKTRNTLMGLGFSEVVTNSFISPKVQENLEVRFHPLRVLNPVSEDLSVLRRSLLPSLLSVIQWNQNRKETDVRIFEIGKIYGRNPDGTILEKGNLGLVLTGRRFPQSWEGREEKIDFFDLKGCWEALQENLKFSKTEMMADDSNLFEPNQSFILKTQEEMVGVMGKVTQEYLESFDIKEEVYFLEVELPKLLEWHSQEKKFEQLPKFPPVDRDLALVVEDEVYSSQIKEQIKKTGGNLVAEVNLFDIYRGDQIPTGKKSLAYAIRYRSTTKTLTDSEVDEIHSNIVNHLKQHFRAQIRA
ncbi:MAG: phenylalanine--tRNA ligase subunit beta [candidate division Zixibacteria bacterium RBG_16_40_9]|nr:MAG: phenylalanine--tRNA ligase subunit beta [candidate division Zixibacteria bacterium RBG_16_40_9]